jgi:hypothetical protein
MTEIEKETAIVDGLKNLSGWVIQRCKMYLAFNDYTRAMEEMYRQGFNDALKYRELEEKNDT